MADEGVSRQVALLLAVADKQARKATKDAISEIPIPRDGRDGKDGRDGVDGKDGAPGRDGIDGKDGLPGADGRDGKDGRDGADGRDGIDGTPGKDGKDGLDGKDGKDGADGIGIEAARVNINGHLILTRTDGEEIDAGYVKGPKGDRGKPGAPGGTLIPRQGIGGSGVTITGGGYTPDGNLFLTLSDGTQVDIGAAPMKFDDYAEAEYLADQTGNGTVRTFTFSAPVQFIVVEMVSTLTDPDQREDQEGRVTTGAQLPTAGLGAVLKDEVPVTLLVDTDTVSVLAPPDTRVTVYGKRRAA